MNDHPLIAQARACADALQRVLIARSDEDHGRAQTALNLAARDIVGALAALPPGPLAVVPCRLLERVVAELDWHKGQPGCNEMAAALRAAMKGAE